MREKIRAFTEQYPLIFYIVFMIFYCGFYMYYHAAIQPDSNYDWDISFLRLAVTFATILFIKEIYQNTFHLGFSMINTKKSIVLLWPLILFGVFNFLKSFSILSSGLNIVWYSFSMIVFEYMVTGLYEEVGMRGVLVNHMMRVYKDKKNGIMYAVLLSSFLFGIVHINNIIRTGPQAVIQCIYAFAIGVVFAAVFIRTRNLWTCVILHGIFDIIGSLTEMFVFPGEELPEYPIFGIESFMNSTFGSLAGFSIMSIICIVAGIYMVRSAKHDEIKQLWKDELEGTI